MLPPTPLSLFAFVFGTILGSFGNVLILRLPEANSIGGRSACPRCGRTLRALDLIPLLSFVLLRAKCRTCRERISWQYPLVELVSGFLFLIALRIEFPFLLPALLLGILLWLLFLIAITDARTGMIPDALNIPFLLIALLYAHLLGAPALLPAAVGGGFFALQWIASRGAWVGSGDILLAAGIGALLGSVPLLLLAFFFAYVSGAFCAVILLSRGKKKMESRLAFGPFLVGGAFVSFFCGERILLYFLGA